MRSRLLFLTCLTVQMDTPCCCRHCSEYLLWSFCGFSELHEPDIREISLPRLVYVYLPCHHILKFWISKGGHTSIYTAENYQITFKMQIKDTVVPFSLIRLIIHLNTCINSIAAHQIINLELEICTSSLNRGGGGAEHVSPRGWEGGLGSFRQAGTIQLTTPMRSHAPIWPVCSALLCRTGFFFL